MVLLKGDFEIFNKRFHYKRWIWLIVCTCFTAYILIDFSMNASLLDIRQRLRLESKATSPPTSKSYFLDLSGCKIPSFSVLDDNIFQYVNPLPKIKCKPAVFQSTTDKLIFSISNSDLVNVYNVTNKGKISCQYRPVKQRDDFQNKHMKNFKEIDLSNKTWTIDDEFIEVMCSYKERVFYRDFHFFVKDKSNAKPFKKGNMLNANKDRLSVMIFGINSLSRLNFHRQMNKTATFLSTELNAIQFTGYNTVANSTYSNIVPILSGLDQNELALACLPNSTKSRYDECPFIWKLYKSAGYRTVMAEDTANFSLFNFGRKGFHNTPTEYYLRPIILELENESLRKTENKKVIKNACYGYRRPVDTIFEYIRKLKSQFQTKHFFSFFWISSFRRDYFNMPSLIDEDMFTLLKDLKESNILNRTAVFIMSNHGLNSGSFYKTYQGMLEKRQPVLYALLPEWFKKRYSFAYENLQTNVRRLTTHFDLHSTLVDLLNLTLLENNYIKPRMHEIYESESVPRDISLFLPVPESRTCETAGIALHWCPCYENQKVPTTDQRVQKAARFVVRSLNELLFPFTQCRQLYLNSIFDATIESSNKHILKEVEKNMFIDVRVHIQTKPGMGEFEATVRIDEYEIMELTTTISRKSPLGKQGFCIDDYSMKMYCYCNR